MTRPTAADRRWPPISARGCAGFASGEPMTITIDVAKGMNASGTAVRSARISMAAIATAPPPAPARTAVHHRSLFIVLPHKGEVPGVSGGTRCKC
jgi:hypothetical protein